MRISDWSSDVCSSDLAFEVEVARNRVLAGLDVAADRVAGAGCLAQLLGRHGAERIVERGLDRQLRRVVELLALGREELDAIVVMRVVRGGDEIGRASCGERVCQYV